MRGSINKTRDSGDKTRSSKWTWETQRWCHGMSDSWQYWYWSHFPLFLLLYWVHMCLVPADSSNKWSNVTKIYRFKQLLKSLTQHPANLEFCHGVHIRQVWLPRGNASRGRHMGIAWQVDLPVQSIGQTLLFLITLTWRLSFYPTV